MKNSKKSVSKLKQKGVESNELSTQEMGNTKGGFVFIPPGVGNYVGTAVYGIYDYIFND